MYETMLYLWRKLVHALNSPVRLSKRLTPNSDTIIPGTVGKSVRSEIGVKSLINTGQFSCLISANQMFNDYLSLKYSEANNRT